jgi:hypothetical protein
MNNKRLTMLELCLVLICLAADVHICKAQSRQETENMMLGTWVYQPSDGNDHFLYVKSQKLEEDKRGFIFSKYGFVIIQYELGCQMPYPNFIKSQGTWRVVNGRKVIIDRKYPGEQPDRMIIKKITKKKLLFTWE